MKRYVHLVVKLQKKDLYDAFLYDIMVYQDYVL